MLRLSCAARTQGNQIPRPRSPPDEDNDRRTLISPPRASFSPLSLFVSSSIQRTVSSYSESAPTQSVRRTLGPDVKDSASHTSHTDTSRGSKYCAALPRIPGSLCMGSSKQIDAASGAPPARKGAWAGHHPCVRLCGDQRATYHRMFLSPRSLCPQDLLCASNHRVPATPSLFCFRREQQSRRRASRVIDGRERQQSRRRASRVHELAATGRVFARRIVAVRRPSSEGHWSCVTMTSGRS